MTTSDLFGINPEFYQDLPDLVLHSTVTVVADLGDGDTDLCGVCKECERGPFGPEPVKDGVFRISWRQAPGGRWWSTDTCTPAHSDEELAHRIGLYYARYPQQQILFRVPAWWALDSEAVA